MAAIDNARFALILSRCAEVAGDSGGGSQIRVVYQSALKPAAEAFLRAHEVAVKAEHRFEQKNGRLRDAVEALNDSYYRARAVVKEHFPDAGLPASLALLETLFDKAMAIETVLNILDDSFIDIDQEWAKLEMGGPFGMEAPGVLKELGEAVIADKDFCAVLDARAAAYGPAFERHLVFKRLVREVFGAHSGQYQSIHWRIAWGKEGAGPVSWGPFSFRAPLRTW